MASVPFSVPAAEAGCVRVRPPGERRPPPVLLLSVVSSATATMGVMMTLRFLRWLAAAVPAKLRDALTGATVPGAQLR
jgi:hypothetical protein